MNSQTRKMGDNDHKKTDYRCELMLGRFQNGYFEAGRLIIAKLTQRPPLGFADEDARGDVYARTLVWLDGLRDAAYSIYTNVIPIAPMNFGHIRTMSSLLIKCTTDLNKLHRWLQPACSFVEATVFMALGRLITFYTDEVECNIFFAHLFGPLFQTIESFFAKKVPMPPLNNDHLRSFDPIHGLMIGVYTSESIVRRLSHVDLYEQPDDWHPIQFYYWMSLVTNFFRGIWQSDLPTVVNLREVPPFVLHVFMKIAFKAIDFMERAIKMNKNYFSLIGPLVCCLCNSIRLLVFVGKDRGMVGPVSINPKLIVTLHEKVLNIASVGLNLTNGDQFLEAIYIAVINLHTLNAANSCDFTVSPDLIYWTAHNVLRGIFKFIGHRMGELEGQFCRPAEYPGFYPPIGFALVARKFDNNEYECLGVVLYDLADCIVNEDKVGLFAYLASFIGKEQAALMALSFSVGLLCIPSTIKSVEKIALVVATILNELLERNQLTRRAIYWINFSLLYSIFKDMQRYTREQKETASKYYMGPMSCLDINQDRIVIRLKRLLNIDVPKELTAGDLDSPGLEFRITVLTHVSHVLMINVPEIQRDTLNTCLQLVNTNAGTRWRKRQSFDAERGLQEVISEFQAMVARFSVQDRVAIFEAMTVVEVVNYNVVCRIHNVIKKYPWPIPGNNGFRGDQVHR